MQKLHQQQSVWDFHFYFNSAVLFFSCCSNIVKTFGSEKKYLLKVVSSGNPAGMIWVVWV